MAFKFRAVSALDYYKSFLTWPIEKRNKELISKPPEFWDQLGAVKAFETFKEAYRTVPAYKDFLKKQNIVVDDINMDDFASVPVVSKSNYLTAHSLKDLSWGGNFRNQHVISVSSGSTGEPFFWPRDRLLEQEVDTAYELLLKYGFEVNRHSSLLVVGYSMGMYVAGPFTFASCLRVAENGYPLTIVTPGIDLRETIRVISRLAPQFDQIILAGYPPFIKDILDAGDRAGIPWKQYRVRFIFGAESFTEKWRDHMLTRVRTEDELGSSSNTYGSADSAILGMETPLSIFVRRQTENNRELRTILFGGERVPALFQYNPLFKYFEKLEDNSLVFTSSAGLPLVRYSIGDTGGVITYSDVIEQLRRAGIKIPANMLAKSHKLPFVYLYDRADFTVYLYGVNIYVDNIKDALDVAVMANHFTGKFVMTTTTRRNFDQALTIHLEMSPSIQSSLKLKRLAEKNICETLRERNSEYNRLFQAVGKKAMPRVKLHMNGEKKYFSVGTKQRWKS